MTSSAILAMRIPATTIPRIAMEKIMAKEEHADDMKKLLERLGKDEQLAANSI